jgi:hypothetical protein
MTAADRTGHKPTPNDCINQAARRVPDHTPGVRYVTGDSADERTSRVMDVMASPTSLRFPGELADCEKDYGISLVLPQTVQPTFL